MELRELLSLLNGVSGPKGDGEYVARCPAHDDRTASLCIREGDKGIVLKCQAGCSTDAVLSSLGIKMRELFRDPRGGAGAQRAPARAGVSKEGQAAGRAGGAAAKDGQAAGKAGGGPLTLVCAYPYTDEHGKVLYEACRYKQADGKKTFRLRRPDEHAKGGWTYSKAGVRLVLYRLPEVLDAIRSGKTVYMPEGEKDCDTLRRLGRSATTAAMGAGKWAAADYGESLNGADVVILPDNDDVGRAHAEQVANDLTGRCKRVRVVQIWDGVPGFPVKGDISDLCEMIGDERAMAILDQLSGQAPERRPDTRAGISALYSKVRGYCVENGCICQALQDGPKALGNFVAYPKAVVTRDDGVNITKEMRIGGWRADGARLSDVAIKSSQFAGMGWVQEQWDFEAAIMPGSTPKDKLRFAISEVGRMTAERITEYTHSGWRKIGGEWAYLYHGGAIGAENVTVDLGGGLSNYRLDGSGAEGWDEIELTDACRVSLDIRALMSAHVSTPLMGVMYLAPLREFLQQTGIAPAFALFLRGGTGTRKSTALALALSHFGNFTAKSLPASFNDTANFIRKKAFLTKDMPIVVDDYHPVTSLVERKKMEATAQSLARAFGDGAERGRMKADLTLQESMPPRGIAVISGEDTPGVGQSGLARYYVINVDRTDVPADAALTEAQELAQAGYLQKAMTGYIRWLRKQVDDLPKQLHAEFIQNRAEAARRMAEGTHGRAPEAVAHIMIGYNSMLRYMRDMGAIDPEDCARESAEAWDTLTRMSNDQAREDMDERPTQMYLNAIGELLSSKSVGVRDLTSTGAGIPKDMIGYQDGQYYYLLPNVAYRAVEKLCSDQGTTFPLTTKMLYKQMREDGALVPSGDGTAATRVKKVDGRSMRLLWIPRCKIDGAPETKDEQGKMEFKQVDDKEIPEEFK